MRLRGFIVGGAIGAAAALYMARKRPGTAAWLSATMSNGLSKLGRKSFSIMMMNDWKTKAVVSAPKHTDGTAAKSEGNWERIEAIINSDPKLKEQANQVMAESSSRMH
ncbi:hypothetical protein [Paenibacillus radicis (ex Gao et al. 2016)]|uniref:Uncharacterized protein n=1 Tax=Paenibacillus radicis (ex Gao et al. 2016) TaxID=1737354 RepID=A0A917GV89_9BACL|nr:hypothetical protein [Paenibacillus radicis (ex Gao et al. 2016)]GGG57426.1 hypothetical protein GCM10010918_08090 [Paenibacillus radicis (ex Gao et al. 2016)]